MLNLSHGAHGLKLLTHLVNCLMLKLTDKSSSKLSQQAVRLFLNEAGLLQVQSYAFTTFISQIGVLTIGHKSHMTEE